MPVEIAVGPPVLSINNGATFMVTDLAGEIQADTEQGVFADDTRFVSYYAIFANGVPWQRRPGTFPVLYPQANVPQAWAAGSVFHLLQAILGLRADAPAGRLYVAPELPRWLPDVSLHGLAVGRARVDLRFWREGEKSRWAADVREGTIDVREDAWRPWDLGAT
jgi:hypothetical protein